MIKRILSTIRHFEYKVFGSAFIGGLKDTHLFNDVRTYCMFIGYPRSGHSIIGSILDAHENIVIAHELNALRFLKNGFKRNQIFHLLLKNSEEFTHKGRVSTGYSCLVPNQWHSKFTTLKIIGDKKGGGASRILENNPDLITKLKKKLRVNIKCIHVIRNPYDMITTEARGGNNVLKNITAEDLKKKSQIFFDKVETIEKIKQSGQCDILDVRHEDFIENPKQALFEIFSFLNIEPSEEFLNDCASIVYKSPHKSRFDVKWPQDLKDKVADTISGYSFLKGYTFNK